MLLMRVGCQYKPLTLYTSTYHDMLMNGLLLRPEPDSTAVIICNMEKHALSRLPGAPDTATGPTYGSRCEK